MNGTAVVYSPDCRDHDTGATHPEQSSRLEWIVAELDRQGLSDEVTWIDPQPVETRWIDTIHSPEYRSFIEEACLSGRSAADFGETLLSHESYHIARLAAGSAVAAVDAVFSGGFVNAFSLARPPGHHARPGEAMGFCLFNNVAIAARYAQLRHSIERIAIIDWDVHHGNGTQESFYQDGSVFFVSFHQDPLYPYSGRENETGTGLGTGRNLNFPMTAHSMYSNYEYMWKHRALPELSRFHPELILISAGFDAHKRDPLAQMNLDEEDFGRFTDAICALANEYCEGRVVSVLEGGYDPEGLARSAAAHLRRLIAASAQPANG